MITYYKHEDGRLVEVEGLSGYSSTDIGWIDMLSPDAEEDRLIEEYLSLSIPTKEDMKDIELSARLYSEDGAEFRTMTTVSKVHLNDPVKTQVTFILTEKFVVSVRYAELTSFKLYKQQAQKKGGVPHALTEAIMLDIMEAMTDRIADSLENIGNEIDELSAAIFRSKKITVKRKTGMLQSAIRKVGEKGELLNMLRESLATISRLISHHYVEQEENHPNRIIRHKMNTLNRDVDSLNDHAAFLSGKMNFMLDATLGMINLEQNQIIKIFSIAAVVFLPPTLVASIYGMNFHNMPELAVPYGYPIALGAMVISAILPLLYFKKKGWL